MAVVAADFFFFFSLVVFGSSSDPAAYIFSLSTGRLPRFQAQLD